jgi:hypothetical protein
VSSVSGFPLYFCARLAPTWTSCPSQRYGIPPQPPYGDVHLVKMGLSTRILQKIVRNEAMASDPPEIYGWRVYLLACSVHLPSPTITSYRPNSDRLASVRCPSAGTRLSSAVSL